MIGFEYCIYCRGFDLAFILEDAKFAIMDDLVFVDLERLYKSECNCFGNLLPYAFSVV